VLVYGVIPFAMFYYEADSDACAGCRLLLPCLGPGKASLIRHP